MKIYTIYKATNQITNKSYIGFSSDWQSRRREHKFNALSNDNKNYAFYNSIRKYGFGVFVWEIIYQSKDKIHTLEEMENHFIVEYNTMYPNGYNMKQGGVGGNVSNDARIKISNQRKGIVFSDEHKNNISISLTGKILTEEHKNNIRIGSKGKNKGKEPWIKGKTYVSTLRGTTKPYKKKVRCSCILCGKEISNNHISLHYNKKHPPNLLCVSE